MKGGRAGYFEDYAVRTFVDMRRYSQILTKGVNEMANLLAKVIYFTGAYTIGKKVIVPVMEGTIEGVRSAVHELREERRKRKASQKKGES